ncbi:hypothetical protein HMPREF9240_01566 [Winkia neuii BV029A5]|uniref:Uncharacterized protein n=1 Tax=Winkia neuii BV029A5 TaxID=888439 RepID=K0YRS1_9ACTO|nr:hypothetical protein HMPREF9240_01566 [Winkia neuii BV029A5]
MCAGSLAADLYLRVVVWLYIFLSPGDTERRKQLNSIAERQVTRTEVDILEANVLELISVALVIGRRGKNPWGYW